MTTVWKLLFGLGCYRVDGRWALPALIMLVTVAIATPAFGATLCDGGGRTIIAPAVVTVQAPRTVTPTTRTIAPAHSEAVESVEGTASVESTASIPVLWEDYIAWAVDYYR